MSEPGSAERHPFISLLLLLLLVFAGAFLFSLIAIIVSIPLFGIQPLMNMLSGQPPALEVFRLLQIFSATGMFVVPAIIFARMEGDSWVSYLKLRSFPVALLLLTVFTQLSSGPLLEWFSELNKNIRLPEFLRSVEEWMRFKEQQLEEITKRLLVMNSSGDLLINLLMLAVIPAFGEEFIFRGCLQRIFTRWTRSHHLAIWVTAAIFSAIHFQFYGFLPRFLLGAFLGYLLVWGGTIWLPVAAHFLNNAVAVITAYVYQRQGRPVDELYKQDVIEPYVYLISIVACSVLLWVLYTTSLKYRAAGGDGDRLD